MVKVYSDKDADLKHLKGRTLAVLGFGSQGHAHALNLKESGCKVIIGLYEGSRSIAVAREHGFEVVSTGEAVRRADVIMVGLPDTKQAAVYERDMAPHLCKGKTLLFTHGFSIHFKTVVPPKDVDVIMVAPKGPGHIVRRQFVEGKGVPSLIALYQNPSKQAKKVALAWAKGIGGLAEMKRRANANANALDRLVQGRTWLGHLAADAANRSNTSVCLTVAGADEDFIKKFAALLDAEGAAYDIAGYRDAPPGLRSWCGATVDTADIEALGPWLDWAWASLRS